MGYTLAYCVPRSPYRRGNSYLGAKRGVGATLVVALLTTLHLGYQGDHEGRSSNLLPRCYSFSFNP
jgi:hypothetical protein